MTYDGSITAWRRCALGGLAVMLTACASLTAPGEDRVPRQLQSRQVIVTLAPASPERWASIRDALVLTHGVRDVGAFPLSSLGVQCVVFQIPPAIEAVCSSWTLAKAVDFAITGEARVLNLSLAGPPDQLLARLIGKAIRVS